MARFPDTNDGVHNKAYRLALATARAMDDVEWQRNSGRVIGHQLTKSATSIGANLSEANAAHSRADFVYKCATALKESHETLYWLRLCSDLALIPPASAEQLISQTRELTAILSTILDRCTNDRKRKAKSLKS